MASNRLAPGLLLAAPRLGDPNFDRTVVLLGKHEAGGSLGWVVNGKALAPVARLLRDSGLLPTAGAPRSEAFDRVARVGGPVAPGTGWLVYRRVEGLEVPGAIDLGTDLAVTGDATAFDAVLRGQPPQDFRLLLGYAGWGPGQLEGEIQAGAWLPATVDADLVLDTEADEVWDAAYRLTIGTGAAAFTSTRRGSA